MLMLFNKLTLISIAAIIAIALFASETEIIDQGTVYD